MIKSKQYILFFLFLYGTQPLFAQNSWFLGDGVQDFMKREQLLGRVNLNASLSAENFRSVYYAADSLLPSWKAKMTGRKSAYEILPVSVALQYNSNHPYGWNDGAMIPAAGPQTAISAGVSIHSGKFTVSILPEFVYTTNPSFETFLEPADVYWDKYYRQLNTIDNPERFGNGSYHKFFAGQSAVRYQTGSISAGISTENEWWGPGRYNALIMGTNAPGFAHFSLRSEKPIHTGIGSFEGSFMAGFLSSSGIFPTDTNRYYNGVRLYVPKKEGSRYITALNVNWQPKWVPGLFVGFIASSYLYKSDVSLADILPVDVLFRTSNTKSGRKANIGSLYARYVMPQENAEIYFEYGRNDKIPTLLNVTLDDGYPRGYVGGLRKLFLSKRKHMIEVAAEFIQTQLRTDQLIRESISWYSHPYVRQGFTNQGQVLGSGIGPGSNSQLIDISWIKGFSKVGVKFERIARDNDFFYNAFILTNDFTRHWIDISTTFHADWQVKKNLIAKAQLGIIRSLNYQWVILPDLGYFKNGYDILNIHANIALTYRL